MFLGAGAVGGDGVLGPVHIGTVDPVVSATADLALSPRCPPIDGMHLSLPAVRRAWRHPARAPGLGTGTGMPLVCGALLTPALFGALPWGGYAAVVPAIVLVRPVPLLLSPVRRRSARREQPVGAWFGPRGFASVVRGLLVLVLQAGIPQGERAYTLVAVRIAASIAVHSSTDVPVARLVDVDVGVGVGVGVEEEAPPRGDVSRTAAGPAPVPVPVPAPVLEETSDARP
ncbi:hypothetical protein [Streptacidiphilus sp. ASG 303]|uniref:hypothetical protein n=1 Tax=Streptacidiphilus sp. ASG 303 TaxID=2896847 RepID=UPI0027DEB2E1|nr:hypothetical protein [Streptacidiphilus sp. ASG 303]